MTCSSIGKLRCNWKNPKNMDSRTRSMQKQHTQRGAHVEKYMQSKTKDSRDSRDSDSAWWKWWRLNLYHDFYASEGMDIHGDWDSNAKTAANWSSPKPQEQRSKTFQALLWHLTVSRFRSFQASAIPRDPQHFNEGTPGMCSEDFCTFAVLNSQSQLPRLTKWPVRTQHLWLYSWTSGAGGFRSKPSHRRSTLLAKRR